LAITRDDWLHAVEQAGFDSSEDPDAITRTEFEQMTGLKRCAATYRLRAMVDQGLATVTRKNIDTPAGRRMVPAYRLVKAQAKKKR
jgi:hypothetical protein